MVRIFEGRVYRTGMRFPILFAVGLTISTAHASESVVHDTTSIVEVDLNSSTVLCSAADYGAMFLKVGIPELARITLLDHQNVGAGAPCVAAGMCEPGNMPEDIIDPAKPTELVNINVKAVRFDVADPMAGNCNTHLIERVRLDIRGTEFTHERYAQLGTRPLADCVTEGPAAPALPPEDDKADDAAAARDAEMGGCSSSSSSTLAGSLVVLGLLAGRRRKV